MNKSVSLGLIASASGGRAAVALAIDGEIKASRLCGTGRRASEELLVTVDEMLETEHIKPTEVTHIAASRGPGSFTGIRVGLSAMLGLCRATSAQAKAYSTLWLMAKTISEDATIVALIPAGRGDIFVGTFEKCGTELKESKEAYILFKNEIEQFKLEGATLVVEEGWEPPAEFGEYKSVDSEECARQAAIIATNEKPEFPIEPLYLRRSWAEEVKLSRERK